TALTPPPPPPVCPGQELDGPLVFPAIGQVQVDREGRVGVPAAGDPARAARLLERPRLITCRGPGVSGLAGRGDLSVARVADRVPDHVVALGAVDPLPVPLSRRVGLDER